MVAFGPTKFAKVSQEAREGGAEHWRGDWMRHVMQETCPPARQIWEGDRHEIQLCRKLIRVRSDKLNSNCVPVSAAVCPVRSQSSLSHIMKARLTEYLSCLQFETRGSYAGREG